MKFPVVFRVLAVLNLLAFFAIGIVSLAMLARPANFGIYPIWIHWTVLIWLFVSSIAWFFANKFSYHFLYSLSFLLLALSGCWVWMIGFTNTFFGPGASDQIAFFAIPGVMILYVIFLVATMFYAPVKSWTEKSFSLKHVAFLTGLLIVVGGGLFVVAKLNRSMSSVIAEKSFPDALSSESSLKGSGWIRLDFAEPKQINGFSMDYLPDNPDVKSVKFARLYYTDHKKIDLRKTPNIIVEFKRVGESFIAEFPAIRVKRMQLFPLTDDKQASNDKETFSFYGINPVWFADLFKKDELVQEDYAEEGAAPEEGNGQKITKANLTDFLTIFFQKTGFSSPSDYMFDYSTENIIVPNGDPSTGDGRLGMYKLTNAELTYYLNDAVKRFQEFEGYDNEHYLWELTGINLYTSKARGYEFAGNGTRFNYINPQMIAWAETYLVPPPDANILGYRAQDYYDKCFQRIARLSAISYLYLSNSDFAGEADLYKYAADEEEFYGPNYLMQRYSPIDLDEYEVRAEGWSESAYFIGFWLRRKVDGTDYKCWNAMRKLLLQYDKTWLLETEANPNSLVVNQIETPEGDGEEEPDGD
jgi:hypothetical protein